MKRAWEEVGDGEILEIILDQNKEKGEILEKMANGLRVKEEQEIQEDCGKIENSEFWGKYKYWKLEPGAENYWFEKNIRGRLKEEWARIRCGSVSKEGKKGFQDKICRVCKEHEETFNHVWECKTARKYTDRSLVERLNSWGTQAAGSDWDEKVISAMSGDLVEVLCLYAISFERLIKIQKDSEQIEANVSNII